MKLTEERLIQIVKDEEIVARLEKFFNQENVLTKQEYNQKILGEEK